MHNGIAPQRSGRNSATQLRLQATSVQQQYTAVLQFRFVRRRSHLWSPPPHGGPQSSEGTCRGVCLKSSPTTAGARKRARWGLNPGPSPCEVDVIPLHHVPIEYLRKWAHTPQNISGLVVEYSVPSLLLLCFCCVSCVCVCCRGCSPSSCSVSSWFGGGLGAMSRRREIHGAATITARRPATLRAQALPGRLEPS